jgi:hypothetical protein
MLKSTVVLYAAAAFFVSVFFPRAANATTVTYDFTLTPYCCGGGPESGSGSFTIVLPPDTNSSNSGNLTLANGGLVSMIINIDGQQLTANSSAVIGYNYNVVPNDPASFQINNIGFSGTKGTEDVTSLSLTSYSFIDTANYMLDTNGSLTYELAPTPLPAALPLFAAGLGALGLFGWRKKRKQRDVSHLAAAP